MFFNEADEREDRAYGRFIRIFRVIHKKNAIALNIS